MNIRMYNCYFGDCFNIDNPTGNNLLVDFGIHNSCTDPWVRNQRFDDIFYDLIGEDIDFLLSHYHEDHYNGVEYVSKKFHYRFANIYIPDIWNFDGCIDAISILLLRHILDGSILHFGTTIFSFLRAVCQMRGSIYFVKRGTRIQNKYIALWPSTDYIRNKAEELLSYMFDNDDMGYELRNQLNQLSTRLQEIVTIIHSNQYNVDSLIREINRLESSISEIARRYNDYFGKKGLIYLRDFGNNISIVFQNIENTINENVLFTGDFCDEVDLWEKVESNFDYNRDCIMHNNYHVIKVGHHGTEKYFHSFIGRINKESVLLIPNGYARKGWHIYCGYSLNALTSGAKVVCSTNISCEARNSSKQCCSCPNNYIIEPDIYIDVI